jgi:hypothetical protein
VGEATWLKTRGAEVAARLKMRGVVGGLRGSGTALTRGWMGVDSRGRKRRQIHGRAEKVGTCFCLHFVLFRSRDFLEKCYNIFKKCYNILKKCWLH